MRLTHLKNMKKNLQDHGITTQLIIIINKCDEMEIGQNGELNLCDPELEEMERQLKSIINTERETTYPDAEIKYTKVSSEDAYIYRMYNKDPNSELGEKYLNKLGANENVREKSNCQKNY